MDNASKNAGDMIDSLTLQYNRGRQAAITNELVDIITGTALLGPFHTAGLLYLFQVPVRCDPRRSRNKENEKPVVFLDSSFNTNLPLQVSGVSERIASGGVRYLSTRPLLIRNYYCNLNPYALRSLKDV